MIWALAWTWIGLAIITVRLIWHFGRPVSSLEVLDVVLQVVAWPVSLASLRLSDFTGVLRIHKAGFKWHVNDLDTREAVLTWYLEINTGGTPHTSGEIGRVRKLLDAERRGANG